MATKIQIANKLKLIQMLKLCKIPMI